MSGDDATFAPALEPADLRQLESAGISRAEAERQLALLVSPPPPPRLVRPCRVGDGIRRLDPERASELAARGAAAAAAGRLTKFVPASGAASRMFADLDRALADGGPELAELCSSLGRFAFLPALTESMAARGLDLEAALAAEDHAAIVRSLLETAGLGYRELPKGLIEFHAYDAGARTAFEEHLIEAIRSVRDADGLCRLHFTVSESHQPLFEALLEGRREPLLERYGARFDVGFSLQSPATDTLAVDLEDRPFRLADGRLLLRPGGHGALIHNLTRLDADVVLIKNIDNVQRETHHAEIAHWKQVLAGHLVELEARIFELGEALDAAAPSAAVLEAGLEVLTSELGAALPADLDRAAPDAVRAYLVERFERPLRVCGVVANQGEPGGGPHWVAGSRGAETAQIVERSQVDASDPAQLAIFDGGTHFNPVDLACGLRDRHGEPFDLERFVDPRAVFVARRFQDGRELRALERPGLWNGAMAYWNTLFVEVPVTTFTPVKTIFDLLRPAHQPPSE